MAIKFNELTNELRFEIDDDNFLVIVTDHEDWPANIGCLSVNINNEARLAELKHVLSQAIALIDAQVSGGSDAN